jgi:hypothetical protein
MEPAAWGASVYNAHMVEADGRYYLYYTGNRGDGNWWSHRNAQRIGVAWPDHPAGPWHRADKPLIDVTPGSWDHAVAACPIVTRGGDGRFYMIYKGVADGAPPRYGPVRMGMAMADNPLGPMDQTGGQLFRRARRLLSQ